MKNLLFYEIREYLYNIPVLSLFFLPSLHNTPGDDLRALFDNTIIKTNFTECWSRVNCV